MWSTMLNVYHASIFKSKTQKYYTYLIFKSIHSTISWTSTAFFELIFGRLDLFLETWKLIIAIDRGLISWNYYKRTNKRNRRYIDTFNRPFLWASTASGTWSSTRNGGARCRPRFLRHWSGFKDPEQWFILVLTWCTNFISCFESK